MIDKFFNEEPFHIKSSVKKNLDMLNNSLNAFNWCIKSILEHKAYDVVIRPISKSKTTKDKFIHSPYTMIKRTYSTYKQDKLSRFTYYSNKYLKNDSSPFNVY